MRPSAWASFLLVTLAVHGAFAPFAFAEPPPAPAAPAPAPAPVPAPPDTVILSDGTTFRGTVRELARGSHVKIEMPDGSVATLPWSSIVRIEHASTAPLPETAPPPPSGGQGTIVVHIESPSDVDLEMRDNPRGDWQSVCESPCDRPMAIAPEYRIKGGGVRASKAFRLRPPTDSQRAQRVVLTVDPASSSGFVLGIVATSIGGASMAIGAIVFLIGAIMADTHSRDAGNVEATGGVMVLVGALGLGGGIAAITSNARSGVEQQAFPRTPQASLWRAPAPTVAVPLLRVSF